MTNLQKRLKLANEAKELIVEELPHEEFDIKIDEIIPV